MAENKRPVIKRPAVGAAAKEAKEALTSSSPAKRINVTRKAVTVGVKGVDSKQSVSTGPSYTSEEELLKAHFTSEDLIASKLDLQNHFENFEKERDNLMAKVKSISSIKTSDDVNTFRASLSMSIMKLRRNNRYLQFSTFQSKKKAAERRKAAENAYLQLQNSFNEIRHLRREIKRHNDYVSADSSLDLVPESEFYEQAPVDISKPDETKNNEYLKHKARLTYELHQRTDITDDIREKLIERENIHGTIKQKMSDFNSIKPQISKVLMKTTAVQRLLGMTRTEYQWMQRSLAVNLSPPMYFLFIVANAYSTTTNDSDFQIEVVLSDESQEKDNDKEIDKKSKKAKESHSRVASPTKDLVSINVVKPHFASLKLNVTCEGFGKVCMHMRYYHYLNLCTLAPSTAHLEKSLSVSSAACFVDPCDMFTDLLDEVDSGKLPFDHPASILLEQNKQSLPTSELYYHWVQNLIGKESRRIPNYAFYNSDEHSRQLDATSKATTSLHEIILAIKRRVNIRKCLFQDIVKIENMRMLDIKDYEPLPLSFTPNKVDSKMNAFKRITAEQYHSDWAVKKLIRRMRLASARIESAKSGNQLNFLSINKSINDPPYLNGIAHFKITIEKSIDEKINACVCLPAAYPLAPAIFVLTLTRPNRKPVCASTSKPVWELERFVNSTVPNICRRSRLIGQKELVIADRPLRMQIFALISRTDLIFDSFEPNKRKRKIPTLRNAAGPLHETPLFVSANGQSFEHENQSDIVKFVNCEMN